VGKQNRLLVAPRGEDDAALGKQVRSYQYLGKDQSKRGEHDAQQMANQTKDRWMSLVQEWP
jgi:hypothetical protein